MEDNNPIKLSIVFLNFNRLQETRRTVEHLRGLLDGRDDIEVIAVDNASVDGTPAYLDSQRHWLRVLHMPSNTGIAGYNEGFKQARGAYIMVLDDDSHPADATTLDTLIAHLDTYPRTGIVACRIETDDGNTVSTWHLPLEVEQHAFSPAFVGCGFAIRRDVFAQAGWYPAEFFLYQNEMEVAIQVRKLGYAIEYNPACRVIHRESPRGRPNWRRVFYPTRNTIWLIRRYFPPHVAAYMIASRLCFGFVRAWQCHEFNWYYKAVREAFVTPVESDILPRELRRELRVFLRQNSVWHHMLARFALS
jgi:GT2 family glycosyltransferase